MTKAWLAVLAVLLMARPAAAAPARASYAIVIGSNASVDPDVAPLHYADDDAARYFDFFRQLGTKVTLLTRVDDATRGLHPQAAAEALPPRRAELVKAIADVSADVAEARRRGVDAVLYFVFAGHGGVDGTRGYLALEDARLTGEELGHLVVDRLDAQAIHMILDACNSYLVAYARGPGGERRPAQDYTRDVYELARNPRVGLLLSTSSAGESHEWDAFQAGVFSHEVRSGLYGAADADGDGDVSYREMGAFIARANEAIVNPRFRPHAFSQAPRGGGALVDLHAGNHLRIDGAHAGRYLLEDARGVRLADFHSAAGQNVTLMRPPPNGPSYLRQLDAGTELVIPAGDGDIAAADLTSERPAVASRGALHASFESLFAYPFDANVVARFVEPPLPPVGDTAGPRRSAVRTAFGVGLMGMGAVALGVGSYFAVDARSAAGNSASQRDVSAQNDRNRVARDRAVGSFIAAGVLAVGAAAIFFFR